MASELDDSASTALSEPPANPPQSAQDEPCIYHIKWIMWSREKTPIIMQNKNGPCPLLALFNVLLLSKRVILSELLEMISSAQIVDHVGANILESLPDDLTESNRLNYEQNMSDAIAIFPKLLTGIDVNIQFKSTSSFEYTPELVVFDLLRIPLLHGWLPDPQDEAAHKVLHNQSYNQVVEQIIRSKESSDEACVSSGLAAEQFLNSTAAQLTCHGVVSLLDAMADGQLAVLFRNNHFSTIYRNGDELFTLVTDQGFLTKPKIVWETLSNVQGDTHFTDASFVSAPYEGPVDFELSPDQQLEQDLQVALSLQESDAHSSAVTVPAPPNPNKSLEESDREMASRLQQQFDEQASAAATAQRPAPSHRRPEEKSKCIIL